MKALFIVLDTLRRDYLPAYGNSWVQTPAIQRLARDSVIFDTHFVGSLPCMPARREFMTGRHNFIYRAWGPIEPFDDVLPVELRKAGIFSHMLTDHDHYFELGGENYHTGFDTWEFFRGQEADTWISLVDSIAAPDWTSLNSKKSDKLLQQNYKNRLRQQREEDFSGPRTAQATVEWLEANRAADNWFLQAEFFDPHEPFTCTEKYRQLYNDTWDGPEWDWPNYDQVRQDEKAIEHIRKCYAGLITMTDHWIGRIFDKLQQLKLWDDTLIVLTTDHGTLLAEHDLWMKNYMPLYNEIVRLPLFVKLPGNRGAGRRIGALTQTLDIMPTFLDYFGAAPPPHLHGRSLRPLLDNRAEQVRGDGIFGYFGKATNITDGRHVYMRNPINADGGPLHQYTAMPVMGMKNWGDRSLYDRVEMGRYFGHTYNLPLYKIPAIGEVPRGAAGSPDYRAHHQLFDIHDDPRQQSPLNDPALEVRFSQRIREHLAAYQAPAEQFTRLGLSPV